MGKFDVLVKLWTEIRDELKSDIEAFESGRMQIFDGPDNSRNITPEHLASLRARVVQIEELIKAYGNAD
jgi:hypothetical protein